MFVCCPVSFDLSDAEWFDNADDAKDDALVWSVELNGENVVVYEAVESEAKEIYELLRDEGLVIELLKKSRT